MDWCQTDIPSKYRKLYEQGRAGKAKAAIRCHCLMCVGWEPAEVERCTATACPLFKLRSLAAQAETEATDRAKRRERALRSGNRPPKRGCANGHGAHEVAPISSATDSPRPISLPGSILEPRGSETAAKDASEQAGM